MALFGKGDEGALREELFNAMREAARLEGALEGEKRSNEDLRAQVQNLSKQVDRLQEALVAKESPVAYAEQKADEDTKELTQEQKNYFARQKRLGEVNRELLERTEADLFNGPEDMMTALVGPMKAEDMMQKLMVPSGGAPDTQPVHGNEES